MCTVAFTVQGHTHQFPYPKEYRVWLGKDEIRVQLLYHVSPGRKAQTLREVFDRNGDGVLQEKERKALADMMGKEARRFFTMAVNETSLAFDFDPAQTEGIAAKALSAAELHALLNGRRRPPPWKAGINRVRIQNKGGGKPIPLRITWDNGLNMRQHRGQALKQGGPGSRHLSGLLRRSAVELEIDFSPASGS